MKYNLEISHEFYLKVRIMDSNLISLLTLGIKVIPVSSCRYVFLTVMPDTVVRLRSGGLVLYMKL